MRRKSKRWKPKEPILHKRSDLNPPKRRKPDGIYYDDIKAKAS